MPSKSKNKGSSYEREIAKFLSTLYEAPFVRVPNSGAYIGGSNTHRKESLSENQIKSFKGDIVPPDSWTKFNAEAKSYADFPFHQLFIGDCKQLDEWIEQMIAVAEDGDVNIMFLKFNRKGKYVVVQTKLSWVADNFMYYSSKDCGDWLIIDFDHFFKNNKDLLEAYSGTTLGTPKASTDTKSIQTFNP